MSISEVLSRRQTGVKTCYSISWADRSQRLKGTNGGKCIKASTRPAVLDMMVGLIPIVAFYLLTQRTLIYQLEQ